MLKLALPLFWLCVSLPAQTTATFNFSANVTYVQSGSSIAITSSGTGTLSGFGTSQLLATANIPKIAGLVPSTPVISSVTMIFPSGDVLLGQLNIPAGYVVPQLGQTVSAVASFTITGGGGAFAGASGLFPNLNITATASGAASVQGSGNGTILTPGAHIIGTPSYSGSFAHFASGAGWETIVTLVNNGSSNAQAVLNFYDESGNPSTVPLDFPQGGTATTSSSYSQTMKPGAVAVIESQGGTTLSVGSVQLLSDSKMSGYLVFRYQPTLQEAAVPLQVQNAASYTLPFDNTGGISTGVALSTTASAQTSVQVTILDDKANPLATDTIMLSGRGHTSFVLGTRYTATNNLRGTIQFQGVGGAQIGVIGIRALSSGAYTTIPPIGN